MPSERPVNRDPMNIEPNLRDMHRAVRIAEILAIDGDVPADLITYAICTAVREAEVAVHKFYGGAPAA